jgi:hypothetical protein
MSSCGLVSSIHFIDVFQKLNSIFMALFSGRLTFIPDLPNLNDSCHCIVINQLLLSITNMHDTCILVME